MKINFIENFKKYLELQNKSSHTITAYIADVKQYLNYCQDPISNEKASEFKEHLHKKNLSPKTISRKLNSLSTFYRYLRNKEFIDKNPLNNVTYPKGLTKKKKILTTSEIQKIIITAKNNLKYFTIISLILNTGIRISEVVNLKVGNLSLDIRNSTLKLTDRTIHLNDKITFILKDYMSGHRFQEVEDFPLFYTSTFKPIHVRNLRSSLHKTFIKAGFEDVSVNDLRSSFIVHQLNAGNSLDFVASVAGHKNTLTTEKYLDYINGSYKDKKVETVIEV